MIVRVGSAIVGLFLIATFISGLAIPGTAAWLTWLQLVGALLAFGIAIVPPERESLTTKAGAPLFISLGLFAMWIVGLALHDEAWLVWCTFAAACAFLLLTIVGGGRGVEHRQQYA